jgi:hypothetical protein
MLQNCVGRCNGRADREEPSAEKTRVSHWSIGTVRVEQASCSDTASVVEVETVLSVGRSGEVRRFFTRSGTSAGSLFCDFLVKGNPNNK